MKTFKEFVKRIVSLDNICQWAERDSVNKESVSQHSFKVSSICVFLLEKIEDELTVENKQRMLFYDFKYKALKKSVLHDFDESIIGRDISHEVKYNPFNGKAIRDALNNFVEHELKTLGLNFISRYDTPEVICFVKLCDWISLLTFIQRNKEFGSDSFSEQEQKCLSEIICYTGSVEQIFRDSFKVKINIKNLIREIYE